MAIDTLGIGIGSVVNTMDVELVVIGGGLAEKLGQDFADRIGSAAAPWMLRPNPKLAWVTAALGDDAGVVGAAALARAEVVSAEVAALLRFALLKSARRPRRGSVDVRPQCVASHWSPSANSWVSCLSTMPFPKPSSLAPINGTLTFSTTVTSYCETSPSARTVV